MARKSKHMAREQRDSIERGVANGDSASEISRAIGTSASTVTREVRRNRTVREPARNPKAKLAGDEVLDLLGVRRVDPHDVVLRPALVPHAVDR